MTDQEKNQRDYWIATGLVMAADYHRDMANTCNSLGRHEAATKHYTYAELIIRLQPTYVAARRNRWQRFMASLIFARKAA